METTGLILQKPLIIFDLETTGTDVSKDRIVQLSITKLFPNGSTQSKTKLINPTIPIPKEASDIHGITDDKVKNEPTFANISANLYGVLSGCDLCGFNILRFDLPLLIEEFLRCNIEFPEQETRFVDSLSIFFKKEERTLSAAYSFYCGKELEGAHDAENDVQATKEVLLEQIKRYNDIGNTVEELEKFCLDGKKIVDYAGKLSYNDQDEIVFTFGKWKDKRVLDHVDYATWMLTKDFTQNTERQLRKILKNMGD